MIDTHCHLTFPDFDDRVDDVLADARRHGVTGLITVSTTPPDAARALTIAAAHDRTWCSAGAHPLYADKTPHDWRLLATIARNPKCVAWGEIGLDNHYKEPTRPLQDAVLSDALSLIEEMDDEPAQLARSGRPPPTEPTAAASARPLPVILHCREAFHDLIPILRQSRIDPARFVFHCFTGTPDDARACLDFGAMISFTGVVTYPNAPDVQAAARLIPLDRIMVETDAPFLSPVPKRGVRPCEPWMTSLTARFLADLRREDWETFHHAINANTSRFFGIDAR